MRQSVLLLLFIFLFSPLYSYDSPYQYGKQVLGIMEDLKPLFPREENSENEKLLFSYLKKHFQESGMEYKAIDYGESEKYHSFSGGFKVPVEGRLEDTLLIVVPLNNRHNQNANRSGSVNIAVALQLMRIFKQYAPALSVDFIFLGAERGEGFSYPIGSRLLIEDLVPIKSAVIYMDLTAPGDRIIIHKSSGSDQSPSWLVGSLADYFLANSLSFSSENIETLAFQSGLEKPYSVLETYHQAEIPMVLLQSRISEVNTKPDDQWVNEYIESLLSLILTYGKGFPEEWDRHYLISELGGSIIKIGERESVLLFSLVTAVLVLILLLKSRNLHLNLKRFRNHFWTLPLLFFLTFLYLFLATLIIEELSGMRDYPDFWMTNPLLFILFKLFLALFLYSGFIYLVKGITLSPSHHFYTYSAFLAEIISLITVMILNISFSYFFLWSLIFISLFMMSRNLYLKRVILALTPLPIAIVGFFIFSEPYYEISRFLITSRITGNLFFTILILPVLMLLSSLNHFLHRFHRHRRSFRNALSLFLSGLSMVFLLYLILSMPSFSDEQKQPLYIIEEIDMEDSNRTLSLSSPAPVGDLTLRIDGIQLKLNDVGREAEITAPMISGLIDVNFKKSSFLDRMSLDYIIDAKGAPDRIVIELLSETPLIIYDSNFPFQPSADGKSVNFHIGVNPALPLNLTFIVSRFATPKINIQLYYSEFPYQFTISDRDFEMHKNLVVTSRISLE